MKKFILLSLLFILPGAIAQAHNGETHTPQPDPLVKTMPSVHKVLDMSHERKAHSAHEGVQKIPAQTLSHRGHHVMPITDDLPASTQDFLRANQIMHAGMKFDYTGDPDIDFVKGMIPHHQGAIDMAQVLLAHAKSGNVKQFAQRVIREQTKEINSMIQHLKRLEAARDLLDDRHRNTDSIVRLKRADRLMHRGMNIDFSDDPNLDFIRGMIPHHQGAIDMASVVLEHGQDANVRTLAWQIVNAQDSEIYWMQSWLRKLNFLPSKF